jgi:hypothetical protein
VGRLRITIWLRHFIALLVAIREQWDTPNTAAQQHSPRRKQNEKDDQMVSQEFLVT